MVSLVLHLMRASYYQRLLCQLNSVFVGHGSSLIAGFGQAHTMNTNTHTHTLSHQISNAFLVLIENRMRFMSQIHKCIVEYPLFH